MNPGYVVFFAIAGKGRQTVPRDRKASKKRLLIADY